MLCFKILHGLDECLNTLHGLCIVAAGTETTYRTVTLDTNHATLCSEIKEWLLQLLVLIVHRFQHKELQHVREHAYQLPQHHR